MARSLNKGDLINLSGSSRAQPIDQFYESSLFSYFYAFDFVYADPGCPNYSHFFFFEAVSLTHDEGIPTEGLLLEGDRIWLSLLVFLFLFG